jgi:hypothetical protein
VAGQPYLPWYVGDWRKDPAVTALSPEARAFWREALDILHEAPTRGTHTASIDSWARMTYVPVDWVEMFLRENKVCNTAGVSMRNGKVTLVSRRMAREEKQRVDNKNRQAKYRSNAGVTQESQESNGTSSISVSSSSQYTEEFEVFWQAYPRRMGKKAAFRNWNTRIKNEPPERLILAAKNYAAYCASRNTGPNFTKLAATFLGPDKWYEDYFALPEIEATPEVKVCGKCASWSDGYCSGRSEKTDADMFCSLWAVRT